MQEITDPYFSEEYFSNSEIAEPAAQAASDTLQSIPPNICIHPTHGRKDPRFHLEYFLPATHLVTTNNTELVRSPRVK